MRIECVPFNLFEVLQESMSTMLEKANEKGIKLEMVEESSLNLTLWGDPFRLKQILLNLLSNAIKFTDSGSVSVISSLSKINNDFVRIQITVKDTGIGISPEQQSLIFEEFTQADPSTTRRYGGTGLGLTIVKKLTELQGGEVAIESLLNEGTSITIAIPSRLKGETVVQGGVAATQLRISKDSRVLIIDDDDVNRIISEEIFKNLGFTVESAGDPSLVMGLISGKDYQIIFTDIQMPGISGYDLVEMINEFSESIPVIAITANSMIDNPNHFIEKGFAGYLIKPYTEEDVIKVIEPFFNVPGKTQFPSIEADADTDLGYDLTDIYRFSGGDRQSAKLILLTFLDNTDKNLVELNNHIHAKELKDASAIAHKMKSAFRQFKIYNIAGLLLKLEKLEDGKENMHYAKELTDELNIQIKPVLKSLKKELVKLDVETLS